MTGPILYSTNPWLAYEICNKFRNGVHYAWCSEVFDPTTQNTMATGSMVAPTSSPRALAASLRAEVDGEDRHSTAIKRYKKKFKRLAVVWAADGDICGSDAATIKATVDQPTFRIWKPLVYIIPRASVASRLVVVPPAERAGHGPEYKILDLQLNEFDALEWV